MRNEYLECTVGKVVLVKTHHHSSDHKETQSHTTQRDNHKKKIIMYVTRPLSMYRRSPSTLSEPTGDAPYSGYLVLTDEDAEAEDSYCWGLCKRDNVKQLPFPQDCVLSVTHEQSQHHHQISKTKVLFIPVPNHPLASNRYYVVRARGRHKGKVYKSSREREIVRCCLSDILNDKRPKAFNMKDVYQIFKIHRHHAGGFFARSIAPDGIAPTFLRKKGWKLHISSRSYNSKSSRLTEALGVDAPMRSQLPSFNFPISRNRSSPVIVGKWYCPFIFVREGVSRHLRSQMNKSMFYSMTLEQRWEEIFSCGRHDEVEESEGGSRRNDVVLVKADVEREVVMVGGMKARKSEEKVDSCGFYWYRAYDAYKRKRGSVGLSNAIVENMRWVEEDGGRACGGREKVVRVREEVRRMEGGEGQWERFRCYVLVESFCLRRLDGRLLLKYDFRHTHKIRCKWE